MDYFITIGISLVLQALKGALKNPAHAAELKSAMLKIYVQIGLVFGSDADFKAAAKEVAN